MILWIIMCDDDYMFQGGMLNDGLEESRKYYTE